VGFLTENRQRFLPDWIKRTVLDETDTKGINQSMLLLHEQAHGTGRHRDSIERQWKLLKCITNQKAQLSLTNPRDSKACQKLLQFVVLTTLSLTILVYLHSFSCCCVREILWKFKHIEFKVIQGHRSWRQSKAHIRLSISHLLIVTLAVSATVFKILTLKAI